VLWPLHVLAGHTRRRRLGPATIGTNVAPLPPQFRHLAQRFRVGRCRTKTRYRGFLWTKLTENCQTEGVTVKRLCVSRIRRAQYCTAGENFHTSASDEIARDSDVPGLGGDPGFTFVCIKLSIDVRVVNGRSQYRLCTRVDLPVVSVKSPDPLGFPRYGICFSISKTTSFQRLPGDVEVNILETNYPKILEYL